MRPTRLLRLLAHAAIRLPLLERLLARANHDARLRRLLQTGAIAVSYPDVLREPSWRVVDASGFSLVVNVAEHRGVAAYFFAAPRPSPVIEQLVEPGATVADVGANVGLYTCAFAALVGEDGRVLAVEPHPVAGEALSRSVAANGFGDRVTVERVALAAAPGTARLFLSPESELSSLVRETDDSIEVRVDTFDALAARHGLSEFALVKVDVEDADGPALAGASALLARGAIRCVLIEMRAGRGAHPVFDAHGYHGFLIDETDGRLRDAAGVAAGTFGDWLFFAPGHVELARRVGC